MLMGLVLCSCGHGDAVPDGEAGRHVGQEITVEGRIAQVKVFRGGAEALDLGGRYPHQTLVIYIPAADVEGMPDYKEGEKIAVKGTVMLYKGGPQIVVKSPGQITEE
jgi:DNA/RNA endonuclease YhcR with UshA esterase domain